MATVVQDIRRPTSLTVVMPVALITTHLKVGIAWAEQKISIFSRARVLGLWFKYERVVELAGIFY